ncbi:hypothetical protein KR018_003007 [Drosophila ironensis]|nr:hypothetical protein KR018_003007 [Drosophila ironensis]
MSSGRRFYFAADLEDNALDGALEHTNNNSHSNNNNNEAEVEADKDPDIDPDDSEFLHEVPYSSSSVDRSSVGSIPWADDAIKKNLLAWERVERLLSGEDPLEEEQEPELRNEVADWQRKFPSLLGRKSHSLQRHHSFESQARDIDSMSNLSLNSLDDDVDDDEAEDGFLTPTAERHHQPLTRPYQRSSRKLVDLLDRDLRVTSVSVKLLKRQRSHQAEVPVSASQTQSSANRLRMPPILNVLDTNRRFRGLLNNRSFVQLTQVQQQHQHQHQHLQQQAKSAVLSQQGNRSAWHLPMAANRFFNNKNAIVLPSLKLGRHRELATTTATSSQSNSSGGGGHNSHGHGHSNSSSTRSSTHPLHPFGLGMGLASVSSNTPSTGRSISAAVHHPRSEFGPSSAFYIPYSASKFKAFK